MNNQIEELKKEIEKLTIKLNNLVNENEKFKKFIPQYNDLYWFISLNHKVINKRYLHKDDEWIVKNTFTFKTEKHAEEYRDFMDMLKEKSRPFKYDECNYAISYRHTDKKIYYEIWYFSQKKELYFDEEAANQLIKDYPNELKHWYLEVPYED